MKSAILLMFLLFAASAFSQEKGMYGYTCGRPDPPELVDSTSVNGSIGMPTEIVFVPKVEWRDQKLVIKWFGRFKILGSGTITTYGLNRDNPTIYGRYKMKGDTLILKCRKSIQHFNKLAPKRRVKVKMKQVYKYIIRENGTLETSAYCYWYKLND